MQEIRINNCDNKIIALDVFEANGNLDVLIIASATGVKKSIYKKFAEYIASCGVTVITFDYLGIGQSLNADIKSYINNVSDWGEKDLDAVIQYAANRFSGSRLTILGHSIGGQLIGMAPSSTLASKIILVAVQSGFWKFWKGTSKFKMWATWYLLFPLLTKLFGYMPSKKFSAMENLPGNVARQWSLWGRNPKYLFAYVSVDKMHFSRISCPITSFSIEDDDYAPAEAVNWFLRNYTSSPKKKIHLHPADYGTKRIGHFGIFSKKFENNIWLSLMQEIKSN
jgi:predicted alpha/beta hydrolase